MERFTHTHGKGGVMSQAADRERTARGRREATAERPRATDREDEKPSPHVPIETDVGVVAGNGTPQSPGGS